MRDDVSQQVGLALDEVLDELDDAILAYDPMTSAHEGYAVILEELDELWQLVKEKQSRHDKANMRHEACQIAAMAVRFMLDVCEVEDDSSEEADEYTETDE